MSAPPLNQMLAHLIAKPSISSVSPEFDKGNLEIIDQLAEWLEAGNFQVRIQPVGNHGNKANIIATLGAGKDGLVLAGHTDTVPWDDGRWQYDPFCLHAENGRLYGLGTADMKSFLALAIEAARDLDLRQLRHPLIIVGTADEESSMDGARLLSHLGYPQARYCIIGEPTDLYPVYRHKGILMEAVRVIGRSGHSSDPTQGTNALDGMQRVMAELLAWRDKLADFRDTEFAVPFPTLNLGYIHGGDNPNRICAECELHFDLRLLPGMSGDVLREELRARVGRALADTALEYETWPLFPGIEAFGGMREGYLTTLLSRLSGNPPRAVSFGTEAPFYAQLGMETVIFGPGRIDQAHQPNEFIEQRDLDRALTILRTVIREICC